VNLTTTGFQIGNTTVNTQVNSSSISTGSLTLSTVTLTNANFTTGNFTTAVNVGANVNLTTSTMQIGNSTVNTQVNSSLISTGNGQFSTSVNVGANVLLTTSTITVGNSTVNTPNQFNRNQYYSDDGYWKCEC
jgi:acyl-CoA hydrolase